MSAISVAVAGVVALATGLVFQAAGSPTVAAAIWLVTTVALLVPLTWSVIRSFVRGDVGVDGIALLAMAGAVVLGQYLAGAVVAVMLSGGNALEAYASRRARRELSTLLERAPGSPMYGAVRKSNRWRSTRWWWATVCSCSRERSSPPTGGCARRRPRSTRRR